MNRIDHMIVIIKPIEKLLNENGYLNANQHAPSNFGVLIPYMDDGNKIDLYLKSIYHVTINQEIKKLLGLFLSFEQFNKYFSIEICYKIFIPNEILKSY